MDATGAGISAAMQCLILALAASPEAPEHRLVSAAPSNGWAMMTWAFSQNGGATQSFIHTDGTLGGSPPGLDRDGIDLSSDLVGTKGSLEMPDAEILEASYPVLVEERGASRGWHGLGAQRSGGACREVLRPHGIDQLTGFMISTRGSVPNQGMAGGGPGARSVLKLRRADGSSDDIPLQAAGVRVAEGETFELQGPTAGGFGDPLERLVELVERDVRHGRITADEGERYYGVVAGSADATTALRARLLAERLAKAAPPQRAVIDRVAQPVEGQPLYPGVVQIGQKAISASSGAVLAISPDPWTGGCCTLDEEDTGVNGYVAKLRSYFDPLTGQRLFQEVVRDDGSSLFESNPDRWSGRASRID
jgi:N-methylhydantoinase B